MEQKMAFIPTLIVFDCDGTLVDSQHLIAEAMRFAFLSADLAAPERSAILRTVGLSLPEALTHLEPGLRSDVRDRIACAYREWCISLRQQPHTQEPMFQGAAALLFDLAASGDILLGIATGKSRRGVTRFIEHNGLKGIFSTIQTADDAPSKPHPAMLLQAMAETGASPGTTVMIGDTSYDMIMAACAGVTGIGVTWGYHSKPDLKKAGAKTIVSSFSALGQELEALRCRALRYEAVA
jgi:phosphoglycolate phosphatase